MEVTMERRNKSFDDHLNLISGQQKTASQKPVVATNEFLQKLAEELGAPAPAPVASVATGGEVVNAAAPVVNAAPSVEAAVAAVADPQVAMAGGVPAIAEAGMAASPVKPSEAEVVTSGDGTAKSINEFGKTPDAAAAAADESVVSNYDAEKTGALIAKSFVENLEKIAKKQEYTQALGILKEAGLLDKYNIHDDGGLEKTASAPVDYLEKIAKMQKLNHDDIIGAANQYIEFVKIAEEAEKKGEDDADEFVAKMNEESEKKDEDDVAAAADPEVAKAIALLTEKGVI
jgi:hypothetical protein